MKQRFLKMKFSEKETYQFVKSYFKQDTLWNTKDLGYKSNQRRLVAYNAVNADFKQATGIELTLTELRIKIKNLKSTYLQELNKIKTRSDGDYQYKPMMKWFALWHKHTQSINNMDSTEEFNTTDDENQHKTWLSETMYNDSVDPFGPQPAQEFVTVLKSEPKLKQHDSNSFNKCRRSFENSISDLSDLNMSENLNSTDVVRDDEFEIYGRYIASQLRSMELQRALTLQLEIQNLMSVARLADLTDQHNSHSNR